MARSLTSRSTNPKIMDDNIKILDDAIAATSTPPAEDVSYDNTDSGLTADDVQSAIDEVNVSLTNLKDTKYDKTIDLSTYDADNPYITESDGYLIMDSGGSTTGHMATIIKSSDNVDIAYPSLTISRAYQTISVYLKKGFKIIPPSNIVSGGAVQFKVLK